METNERKTPQTPRRGVLQSLGGAWRWFWENWTDETSRIYQRAADGRNRARVRLVTFLLFVRELIREFWRVEVTARAASLAYTTLLSLVPLLIAFSGQLGQWFSDGLPEFRSRLDQFLNIVLPYESSQFAYHINQFMEKAGAASSVGGVIFLVISFRLFMAVEGAFNQIWRIETARGYRARLRAFTMILFWGPLLIGLSFSLIAAYGNRPYVSEVIYNPILARVFPAIVLFVAFTMLFWLVPGTKVQLKSAAVGAIVAAILFEAVRFGFAFYVQQLLLGRMNVIYGTMTLLILFLIALELMWLVILLGVEVAYVHQNLQGTIRATKEKLSDTPEYDVYFALRALIEVARRFERREDAPSSYRLAEEFGATDTQMIRVLRKLEDAQLVKEIGGDWTGFSPGCDPDRISVEEVLRVMEGGNREVPPAATEERPREAIAEIFNRVQACTRDTLDRLSIGRIVRDLYGPRRPSRGADEWGRDDAAEGGMA